MIEQLPRGVSVAIDGDVIVADVYVLFKDRSGAE
jgi:hypothetical protein